MTTPVPPHHEPAGPGAYPVAPAPAPGPTLAVVGLVTAAIPCTALVGLVISIVALVRARRGLMPGRGLAVAGVVVGAFWLVVGIAALALGGFGILSLWQTCQELGDGVHEVDGVTYTCDV